MKVNAPENTASNAGPVAETEGLSNANTLSPPAFSLSASGGETAQLQTNDTEPGEAITDATDYYVSKSDATIRQNSNPAQFTSNKIPIGTKVKRVRTFNGGAVAQVEVLEGANVGTKYWTTFSNVTASAAVTDSGNRYVFFNDTYIYNRPYGSVLTTGSGSNAANQTVAAGNQNAYTISERCGVYAKLMQGTTVIGWVQEGGLTDQASRDRGQYLADLKTWLGTRLTEVNALTGDAKKQRILGILSLVENICHQIEANTFPTIADLSTTPAYVANGFTSFVPPELTLTVRNFIVQLEAGEPAAGATLLAGEEIDWNARLGVPQYRTQSDNLTPQEATCGPTSFTMGAERLGYSRADMISAIDAKLRESMAADATQEQVEAKFVEKAEDFFDFFATAGDSYQKLRGNKEGIPGNEATLAAGFREWGQYEDLSYFLAWLRGHERGTVASGGSADMLGALHNASGEGGDGPGSDIISFNATDKLTMEHRQRIQSTLAAGGAVILSLHHKGTSSGTHITTVREVLSNGLAMDDPYGQINPEYRRGETGDAFNNTGIAGANQRGNYNWKNVPHFNASENDYSQRDFTRSAAEELTADESRGQNEVLSWEQINDGPSQLINYLRFYTR